MGFSAGGEQAAWVTLKFDDGNPHATDLVERESCASRFFGVGLCRVVENGSEYVPKNTPPTFLTSRRN